MVAASHEQTLQGRAQGKAGAQGSAEADLQLVHALHQQQRGDLPEAADAHKQAALVRPLRRARETTGTPGAAEWTGGQPLGGHAGPSAGTMPSGQTVACNPS